MYDQNKKEYHNYVHKKVLFCLLCIILIAISLGLGVKAGKYDIGFFESYQVLFDHLLGNGSIHGMDDVVIWEVHLPRALAGLIGGAGLGVCGAVMQSSLKNPLADPYTTGISSGASLGATLAIIAGVSMIPGLDSATGLAVNAFIFAMIPAMVIILISTFKKNMSSTSIILIGVAVMYVFSATDTLLKVSTTVEKLADAYVWGVGTLGRATWDNLPLMAVVTLMGLIFFIVMSDRVNIMSLNDDSIRALGEDPKKIRIGFMAVVALMTSVVVSVTGTIGFVGLVAPHIVRLIIGSDCKYLIPASACFGAAFLMCADCLARVLTATGLPVGVITALIGGPLFLFILIKMRNQSAW